MLSPSTVKELKSIEGPIEEGTIGGDLKYRIELSRKSAVEQGAHLVISFPTRTELTETESAQAFQLIIRFARGIAEAREFGFRFAMNFGPMQTRPEAHAHLIIPATQEERELAPRLVDPWQGATLPR